MRAEFQRGTIKAGAAWPAGAAHLGAGGAGQLTCPFKDSPVYNSDSCENITPAGRCRDFRCSQSFPPDGKSLGRCFGGKDSNGQEVVWEKET